METRHHCNLGLKGEFDVQVHDTETEPCSSEHFDMVSAGVLKMCRQTDRQKEAMFLEMKRSDKKHKSNPTQTLSLFTFKLIKPYQSFHQPYLQDILKTQLLGLYLIIFHTADEEV